MPHIDHFSASSIGRYTSCPFSYYLHYIKCEKKERSFIDDSNLIFGKIYHRGLEYHYTDGKTFDDGIKAGLAEIYRDYERDVSKAYFQNFSQKLRLRASKMFQGYQKSIVIDFEPIAVEQHLHSTISDPVTGNTIFHDFIGIIDMVLDESTLCDHKTAGGFYRSLRPSHIRQANIYAMLFSAETRKNPTKFFLSVHNRNSYRWKRYDIDISKEQRHKTFEEISDVIHKVENAEFTPTPGDACVYCPYWEQYYNSTCKFKKGPKL